MTEAPKKCNVVTTIVLNTGHEMPVIGLGTFLASKPGEVFASVESAIQNGYRLIDCAAGYGNEKEIGKAITEVTSKGIVTRSELFIVSKLFQTHHDWEGNGERCKEALEQTLADLQSDYLDLYLMHWPFAFEQKALGMPQGRKRPLRLKDGSPNPIWNIRMEYLNTWRAMEEMVVNKKVRAIGVSNFTSEQLDHLIEKTKIKPAVNQIELHPYLYQKNLLERCTHDGIQIMGYSPLGSSFAQGRSIPGHNTTLLEHPTINMIANNLKRTAAQVLIRWSLDNNAIVIPKSTNSKRIKENIDVLDWTLSKEQKEEIDSLNCKYRYFMSYLKRPDNNVLWHDGVLEEEND